MRSLITFIFFAFFANTLPMFAKAADQSGPWENYIINSEHSEIRFEVPYMGMTSVSGRFEKFKGTFQKHRKTSEIRKIHVVIQARGLNTSDEKRDKHLRSADFFDVKNFPKITLTEGKITSSPNREFDLLRGQLTLRGTTRPFVLKTKSLGQKKDQMGREVLFFKTKGQLNRKEFGMSWNQTLDSGGWVIGDVVDLSIRVEASPTNERPAFSRFMRPGSEQQEIQNQRLAGASVTKDQPPEQLTELNQRVDQLHKQLTNSKGQVQRLKNQNENLSSELRALKEQTNRAKNFFASMAFALIAFFFIGTTLFFIKRKRKTFLITLPESKYPLKEKDRFLIEWLCDFSLVLSFILIIALSILWFS